MVGVGGSERWIERPGGSEGARRTSRVDKELGFKLKGFKSIWFVSEMC